jgi:hypothetical protein
MSHTEFSASWLQLREPADRQARADALIGWLCDASDSARPRPDPLPVLDLGAGTGANLRHLAPKLRGRQQWRCVDQDAGLLEDLCEQTEHWAAAEGARIDGSRVPLSLAGAGWEAAIWTEQVDFATGATPDLLPRDGLVTASALLDLVSEEWLERLIARCRDARCSLLFALTYDGRIALSPSHPDDQILIELVNRHQQEDKGFGAALGPQASSTAERLARAAGYRVWSAQSDWALGADLSTSQAALQAALIAGWRDAACELEGADRDRLHAWHGARADQISAGRLRIQVGHRDLVALPSD